MHEITFSSDDKPKLLSQVHDGFSDKSNLYVRKIANIWSDFYVYICAYAACMIDGCEQHELEGIGS